MDGSLERGDKAQCEVRPTRFQMVLDGLVDIALGRFP